MDVRFIVQCTIAEENAFDKYFMNKFAEQG